MKRNTLPQLSAIVISLLFFSILSGCGQTTDKHRDEISNDFDPHGSGMKYFFDCDDMDFHFGNLVLGSAVNNGVSIGEAFYAASRIINGDAKSWQSEWTALAKRVKLRGDTSLMNGHTVSAIDQYLRASYYYRISVVSMLPDNPGLETNAQNSRKTLLKAGELLSPKIEYVEIPFEGTVIPGFFRKANTGNEPTKTLLMIGGGETFAEDLYFYLAKQAFDRGYNFMTVDLPGQGIMPLQGQIFRADTYVTMKSVVDYVLSRSDVDAEKLVAYGISGGGEFVPQAAEHDKRIKAIAMNSGVYDARALFATMPVTKATKEEMAGWTNFHRCVVQSINWRWGLELDNPAGLVDANKGFEFEPANVSVPVLLVIGEGEYKSEEVQRQQNVIMDNVNTTVKKQVITPSDEGATNHCVMENRNIIGQVVFDFFDEVID